MDGKRFIKTYTQGVMTVCEVWVDRETGVNYFFCGSGSAGGLSVLVDADGRPVVTDPVTLERLF